MIDHTFNGGDNGNGWFLNMMSKELSFIGSGGKMDLSISKKIKIKDLV